MTPLQARQLEDRFHAVWTRAGGAHARDAYADLAGRYGEPRRDRSARVGSFHICTAL